MSERKIKGFTFWDSYYEAYKKLSTKKDKLMFIEVVFSYVFDGEVTDLTKFPTIDVVFSLIKPNLDNSLKKARNGSIKKGEGKTNINQTKSNANQTKSNANQKEEEKEEEIKEEHIKKNYKKEEREEGNYGTFENVQLTLPQYESIVSIGAIDYIDRLSVYMESTGKTYRNHYATIVRWFNNDERDKRDRLADKLDNQFADNLSNVVDDDELDRDAMLEEIEKIRGAS